MALDQVDVDKYNPDTAKGEMSFLDHLEHLRWHIIRAFSAIVIAGIAIFLAKSFVFDVVIFGPKQANFVTYQFFCSLSEMTCFSPPDFTILPRELGEQFLTHIKVSFWLGLIIAFPFVFWEVWRFIKPGLYAKEQKAARGIVFICSFLFMCGILFGYYVISPFAMTFLGGYTVGVSVVNASSLASYVNYMTMFTIPTGLVFEMPIVVYFLAKVGLITPAFMRKYRKHSFVIILIIAAIITPPDVITQFLIGIPLYILYEASIIIAKRVEKKAAAED